MFACKYVPHESDRTKRIILNNSFTSTSYVYTLSICHRKSQTFENLAFIYRTRNKTFLVILLFEHWHKDIFTYQSTRKQKLLLILQHVVLQLPFRKFRHNLIPEINWQVLINKSVLVKHKNHLLWKRKKQSDYFNTLKPSFLLRNICFCYGVLGCSFPWKARRMPWTIRLKFHSQSVYVHSDHIYFCLDLFF